MSRPAPPEPGTGQIGGTVLPADPAAVLAGSLFVSLVLWLPSALAVLRGDIDLPVAGLRYLAAFTVARLGVGLLARLVASYRSPLSPAASTGPPHRRRDD